MSLRCAAHSCLVALALQSLVSTTTTQAFFLSSTSTVSTRRRTTRTSSSSSKLLSKTSVLTEANQAAVNFIDPVTGCEVVLLGCFHGTESSATDVEDCLLGKNTHPASAVVLELCPTRFADLRRDILEQTNKESNQKKDWFPAYAASVSKTIQSRGLATGIAAAILGGVSGLQTSMTGFQPGLEFQRAIQVATNDIDNNCQIFLADQAVETTLQRMGSLPQIAATLLFQKDDRKLLLLQEDTQTLTRAIFGDSTLLKQGQQLSLASVLTRSRPALQDLARLTIPPVLALQSLLLLVTTSSVLVEPTVAADPTTSTLTLSDAMETSSLSFEESSVWTMMIMEPLVSAVVLVAGYLAVALPAVRVILTERDEQLARGIRAACRRIAATTATVTTHEQELPPPKVVAVLGFLHVNGVAKRLLEENDPRNEERSEPALT